MKQYPLLTNKPAKFLFLMAMTALLFLSRDTVYTVSILGIQPAALISYGIIAVMGIVFLICNRKQWKQILMDKRIAWMLITALVFLLPMVAKADWQMMYFTILICLLFSVFLTYVISYRDLGKYYVLIMCFICVNSLIGTYILKHFAMNGTINPDTVYLNGMREVFHFGFSFVRPWVGYYRNFGIFREPGVFQFYLILALFFNNFWIQWPSRWQYWLTNILLSVTMLSTFATGGVLEMVILFVMLFFVKGMHKRKNVRRAVLFGTVLVCVILLSLMITHAGFRNAIQVMINKPFVSGHSRNERLYAMGVDLMVFLKNPIFGEKLSVLFDMAASNTASTLILLAGFGCLVGTVHVLSWAVLVWDRKQNILINLGLLAAMLLSFNTQNLITNQFFWLFSWMALTERGLPWLSAFLAGRKTKKK